jgi:hypothetical protein
MGETQRLMRYLPIFWYVTIHITTRQRIQHRDYLSIYLSIYLFIYLYIYLSVYLFIYLYIYLFVYLFIYPFIYISFYLSIYLSICLSVCLSIYLWLYSPSLGLGQFFSFLIFYTVGGEPWTGDQPVTRPLPEYRTVQTQNKRTQTSMPQMGFEPTISVFKRAKTVHALDCVATVISSIETTHTKATCIDTPGNHT